MQSASKLELVYGPEIANKIHKSNLLVVGAGGIGCEVMKTLSLTGFKKITIIDLDTIDVSNLNRQFLFRREHVDKSKAEVLRDQILKQNPSMQIQAYVGRIQEDRFGFKFFSEFDLVINALDNEEARKHVNNMCFNFNIPLVDSGTNGYAAQCVPICKGKTPCYQCIERPTDQSFPICTIRQKPEKMIHCIVWAKALYDGLFGPKEQSNNIMVDITMQIQEVGESTNKVQQAQIVFDRVFGVEVLTLLESLNGKIQKQETPIQEEKKTENKEGDLSFIAKMKPLLFSEFAEQMKAQLAEPTFNLNQQSLADEQSLKVLTLQDYIYEFVKSIVHIYTERSAEIGTLMFNKDDETAINFVASASNIRAYNFSIPMETKFKIKEMAGKIIPAISSSNALVAALQVTESIKILSGNFDQLHGVVYQRLDALRLQSFKRLNEDPNPDCQICTNDSRYIYTIEVQKLSSTTFRQLLNDVFYGEWQLSKSHPLLVEWNNQIMFETGDDLDEDDVEMYERRLAKVLTDLRVKDNCTIQVQGVLESQTFESQIYAQIIENSSLTSVCATKLLKKGIPQPKKQLQPELNGQSGGDDEEISLSDDDVIEEMPVVGVKRSMDPAYDSEFKGLEEESVQAKRKRSE